MRIIHHGSTIENSEPPNWVPTKLAVHGRNFNSVTALEKSSANSTRWIPVAAYGGHNRIVRRIPAALESRLDQVGSDGSGMSPLCQGGS